MIPRAHITAWRSKAPWSTDAQVEQDLVICRVIVELFSDEFLKREVAFRGGTALHKLHFNPPSRYSEDIDLVQVNAGPMARQTCLPTNSRSFLEQSCERFTSGRRGETSSISLRH